jgi:hypothetical protein
LMRQAQVRGVGGGAQQKGAGGGCRECGEFHVVLPCLPRLSHGRGDWGSLWQDAFRVKNFVYKIFNLAHQGIRT